MATLSSLVVRLATNTAQFTSGIAKSTKDLQKFAKGVRGIQRQLSRGLVAGGSIIAADATRNIIELGDQLADLRAITGAAGEDLDVFRNRALELAADSTKSSDKIVNAFKLVGSAKPELLSSSEALAAVTRQVVTLADAARLDLPEAVKAVTVGLNQFGAGADQAARFVNVLAAGSKAGASEIAETAQAIRESGTIAAQSGASFEELNGLIQTLAESQITAGKAGNALKNIFINLESQTNDRFKPSVVGVAEAFKNLNAENLSTTERVKLFGKEALSAANVLVDGAGKINSYTEAVTGTRVANEQAAAQTDSLAGDLKRLGAQYDAVSTQIGSAFEPAQRGLVQSFTDILSAIDLVIEPTTEAAASFGVLDFVLKTIAKSAILAVASLRQLTRLATVELKRSQSSLQNFIASIDFRLTSEQRAIVKDSIASDFAAARINIQKEIDAIQSQTNGAFDRINFGRDAVPELEEYIKRWRELNELTSQAATGGNTDTDTSAISGLTDAQIKELQRLEEQARSTFDRIRRSTLSQSELINENLQRDIAAINEVIKAIPELSEQATEVIAKLTDQAAKDLEALAKKGQEETNKLSVYSEQAARNMQSIFADFLFDPFDKGVKGMLKGFVDAIRRMVAEAAAAKLFEQFISNDDDDSPGFFSFLGGNSSGSSSGGVLSAITGGKSSSGIGQGKATVQIVQNNDFRGADSSVLQQLPTLLEQNRRQTEANIADSLRRGLVPTG